MRVLNPSGTSVGDAGGSAGSSKNGQNYLTEIGITNTGTPLCVNDALTSAVGGYHQLCLGANALGGGLVSYNAYGGAAALPLSFEANGTTFIVGQITPCIACGTMASQNANAVAITGGSMIVNSANYVAPPGPFDPNPSIGAASFAAVLGSAGAPDTTLNIPLVIEKIGTQASGPPSGAIVGINIDANVHASNVAYHGTAITGVFTSNVAYAVGGFSFGEGLRGQCDVIAGSTGMQCGGIAGEVNFAVNGSFFSAIEGAVNNTTGGTVSTLSLFRDVAFIASCGDHGGSPNGCGAAYFVNQNNAFPFLCGFCIGPGTQQVIDTGADIYLANTSAGYGLDMHAAVFGVAAIFLPNENAHGAIRAVNAAGTSDVKIISYSGIDQLTLGTDTATTAVVIGNSTGLVQVQNNFNVQALVGSGSRVVCVTAGGQLEAGTLASGLVTCP